MSGSANFRGPLQDKVLSMFQTAVGQGTDPTNYVEKFQTVLPAGEIPEQDFPCVIVNVRSAKEQAPGEMGTLREVNEWIVYIVYLDIDKVYDTGEQKRDDIVHRMQMAVEMEPRLENLMVAIGSGSPLQEYVYDSNFTEITFDQSGQDEYYTFTAEMFLSVDTAKSG